ncbi:hypothetical protein TorRG33x02_106080 [Trema orientale]|uniref:Uncharacterized protein n=1 Tax=Trema orientale TaxID=63057 RepID=A0A2P5F751_TREOI|nr:hypothetical protein TorRG33x02_106080 [Trema orientale]
MKLLNFGKYFFTSAKTITKFFEICFKINNGHVQNSLLKCKNLMKFFAICFKINNCQIQNSLLNE